jgi:hypothetical protein
MTDIQDPKFKKELKNTLDSTFKIAFELGYQKGYAEALDFARIVIDKHRK